MVIAIVSVASFIAGVISCYFFLLWCGRAAADIEGAIEAGLKAARWN